MSFDTQPTVVKTTATGPAATRPTVDQVDVRGPRFAAWITTAVLALVLVLSNVQTTAAAVVLAVQAVVFAVGAVSGPRRSPYGARVVVRWRAAGGGRLGLTALLRILRLGGGFNLHNELGLQGGGAGGVME